MKTGSDADFESWTQGFRARALTAGLLPQTFGRAFHDIRFDPAVIAKDRNQGEDARTIWDYLDRAVSQARIYAGLAARAEHGGVLERIAATYGVAAEVIVAIWGMESSYGTRRGDYPVIGALATLACDGRRGAFFEAQLIAALQIVQSGDVHPLQLMGSWAGAMGHAQFMPTSYLAHAVDFDGDGRRDIWSDDPTDALASAAAYLAKAGWHSGQPWGVEVTLPPGFDYAGTGPEGVRAMADWAAAGIRCTGGGDLPEAGPAFVLVPAGARGAAFLAFGNFGVIRCYNAADAYALGVGHLADRIAGGGPIRAAWPREERALTHEERVELQQRLSRAGFDTGGADGRIGPNTIAALRAYQRSVGAVPDGYAAPAVLQMLR